MTQPRSTLGVGSTFHNWKLERILARGGGGTVYLATHRLVPRRAAIKVLSPLGGASTDEDAIRRFHVEVDLSVSLRSPNLPDFYDAELMPDGTAVLVLEHLDGLDLERLLEHRGRLPIADSLFLAAEVLRALHVVHDKGIHRDLKPSNLFIRRQPRLDSEGHVEKGRVVLLDFGLAKIAARAGLTKHIVVLGTKCYMSPEQLRGEPLDGRSDLYALGVVLYEMLRGAPLFHDEPDAAPPYAELARKHLHEEPRDLRLERTDVPSEVWSFVQKLLAKDREDRFATAAHALEKARSLCGRHAADADMFRAELAPELPDIARVDPAPVTERMTTPPGSDGDVADEDGPPTEADPIAHGTEPLRPEGEPLDPWEARQLAHLRAALRAPRIFRDPAVARLDPTTGRILELQPLGRADPAIGSAIRVRQDRSLELVGSAPVQLEVGLVLHTATTGAGEIVHGTRFTYRGGEYQLLDRTVVEPSPYTWTHRRFAPLLAHVSRATGAPHAIIVLNMPLAVIGSLPACDLVIPTAPPICAAVWLRADGQLEVAHIDVSRLPYGQPVTACRFISERRRVHLGGDDTLRIYERRG